MAQSRSEALRPGDAPMSGTTTREPPPLGPFNYGTLFLVLIAILSFRYYTSWIHFHTSKSRRDAKRTPPTVPYLVPLLGTVPLGYVWSPMRFVMNPKEFFQQPHPVHVKILHYDFYIVQGTENIKALFKNSWSCTSTAFTKFALGYAFGLPASVAALFDKDDSGSAHAPHPDSEVEARNRIDYLDHQSVVKFLEGPGLMPFWNRFAANITGRMRAFHQGIGSETRHYDDLMRLVSDEATTSLLDALCGPHLLRLNPGFLEDFWAFDRNLQTYMQGLPWFLAPRAYASRQRVLDAVRAWQSHARENFRESDVGPDGDDPYWGSSFFRERHGMYLAMDGFTEDAIASPDFGAMWASRNSIAASSWIIYETFRDPRLLSTIRSEVDTCVLANADGRATFDVESLLRLPVLQAVYAETLRLRMHFYLIRMPDRTGLEIGDWVVPRRRVIVTSTTAAHRDAAAWSAGPDGEHPVDAFWPGRFLKYPDPERGGPPAFSTKELEGSWVPFGGGPRQCPGRHFAKRQILLTTALMVALFDVEILPEGRHVGEDVSLSGFGGGVSHPAGKVPVRIRRRGGDAP